ncbi:MAG: hypothetical protein ACFFED_17065 [Candidatus Thorarchaeota archaeon]
MLESAFVVHLDDYHGFIVEKRYPASLSLNERLINELYFVHQGEGQSNLKLSEIDGRKIVSYMHNNYPSWMICYIVSDEEDVNAYANLISGMSRLILELLATTPDVIDLQEILENRSILPRKTEEQRMAEVFLTPSTALILERMQQVCVESAAKLSIWLKNEIQSDTVDIREAVSPLIKSNIVKVEMIGKTREIVFLIKDIFCYRSPPVNSLTKVIEEDSTLAQKYMTSVKAFFSPPPPEKGYNPALPVDDPNSPIVDDREMIARILANRLHYAVLSAIRNEPLSVEGISKITSLPIKVVQNSLWALESERIVSYFETENLWGLITNPTIEVFMPEYGIPIVSHKLVDKEINIETASRYYDLLAETWSEN